MYMCCAGIDDCQEFQRPDVPSMVDIVAVPIDKTVKKEIYLSITGQLESGQSKLGVLISKR